MLQEALGVAEDAPDSTVSLPAFLGRFPPHLRPLVQPLFFRLALEPGSRTSCWRGRRADSDKAVGMMSAPSSSCSLLSSSKCEDEEPRASWPRIVAGVSCLVRTGASWPVLLEAWVGQDGTDPCAGARAEAAAELAAALCFWCAHPSRTPGPGVPGGVPPSAAAAALAGWDSDPLDAVLTALRRPEAAAGSNGGTSPSSPVSSATVRARLSEHAPCLPNGVGPRMAQALLEATAPPDCPWPQSHILDRGFAFLLRGVSKALWASGAWELLYSSRRDGHSFAGLLAGVLRYPGLAVLLLRAGGSGEVLGAVSDCWEEGNGAYGGSSECLLFTLWPTLQAFRSTGRSKNYVYMNSRNKSAPRGLGFGGQVGCCRLWISSDLEDIQVLQTDATYAAGPLLAGGERRGGCPASDIEVWGLGGAAARAAQCRQRSKDA